MRKTTQKVIISIFLLLNTEVLCSQNKGTLIIDSLYSPSANHNIFEDKSRKEIAVYLPPSYSQTTKRFPVIYYLTGYSTEVSWVLDGVFDGFVFNESMDSLILNKQINEMIIVVATSKINVFDIKYGDNHQYRLGTCYSNSPVTGYWEDFIVKELVSYMDSNYRTIPKSKARAISGHSMGGIGALNIGLKYPDIFANIYSINGGLISPEQADDVITNRKRKNIDSFIAFENKFKNLPRNIAYAQFKDYMNNFRNTDTLWNGGLNLILAYGASYVPNIDKNPPYIDYPYYYQDSELQIDSLIWNKWFSGFGGFDEKLQNYKMKSVKLNSIVVEFSTKDKIPGTQGSPYLIERFCKYEVPHIFNYYEGDHSWKLKERIDNHMLPFLSKIFEYE